MMWVCSLIQYLSMLIQWSEPGTDRTEEFEHLNWKERIWVKWLHRLLQNRLHLWNLTPKILSRGSNNYYSHFRLTIREIKLYIIPPQEYDASIKENECSNDELTKKINDQSSIARPARWFMKKRTPIWRAHNKPKSSRETAGVGIRVSEDKNDRCLSALRYNILGWMKKKQHKVRKIQDEKRASFISQFLYLL